jgi:ABC-type branched-subunit amino acid transport system substrate-binding protein
MAIAAATACSVSAPRNGVLVADEAGVAGANGLTGVTPDGQPVPDGVAVAGAEPAGAAVGPAAGRGSTVTGASGAVGGAESSGSGTDGGTSGSGSAAGPSGGGGGAGTAGGDGGSKAAGPNAVGVTASSITISVSAGYSGIYGALFTDWVDNGFGTWVADVNARGGVNGRKIAYKKVDNADSAEGGVAACKTILSNGTFFPVTFAGLNGADANLVSCVDKAGMPSMTGALTQFNTSWKHAYSFATNANSALQLSGLIKNVARSDSQNVGLLYVDDPYFSAAADVFVKDAPKKGVRIVNTQKVSSNQASFVSEMTRMRDAGAKTVVIIAGGEAIGAIRDAKSISYSPQFIGLLWQADEVAKAAGGLFQGVFALRQWATTDTPQYKKFVALARKHGKDPTSSGGMVGYGVGLTLERALAGMGSGGSWADFERGIQTVTNYNNGYSWPVSWGAGVRQARFGQFPLKCCNGDNTWASAGPAAFDF